MKQSLFYPVLSMQIVGVVLFFCLAGCSTTSSYMPNARYLGVYKMDVNQGNYLTQDMVEKLKVGQSRQQVRAVLGTPLVASAFHADRWDYVYSFARRGKEREHRQFVVFFEDDKLARWEGDEAPVSQIERNRIAGAQGEPLDISDSFFDRMFRWFGDK